MLEDFGYMKPAQHKYFKVAGQNIVREPIYRSHKSNFSGSSYNRVPTFHLKTTLSIFEGLIFFLRE
jgi:hypothetical protein